LHHLLPRFRHIPENPECYPFLFLGRTSPAHEQFYYALYAMQLYTRRRFCLRKQFKLFKGTASIYFGRVAQKGQTPVASTISCVLRAKQSVIINAISRLFDRFVDFVSWRFLLLPEMFNGLDRTAFFGLAVARGAQCRRRSGPRTLTGGIIG